MARKRKLSVSEAGMLPLADYVNVPKAKIQFVEMPARHRALK